MAILRVAIIQSDGPLPPLTLPDAPGIEIVLRASRDPQCIEALATLDVRVVVLDLRGVEMLELGAMVRSVREVSASLRIVAVTDAGDDAAAQLSLATGAVAHLGRDLDPMTLLRAVHAASRGALHLGRTGQRAMRRLLPEDRD